MQHPPCDILAGWGLEPGRLRPDVPLCGSPERCHKRWVLEDTCGDLWILELLHPQQAERRERIGRLLQRLQQDFACLAACRETLEGAFVLQQSGFWQLTTFIPNEPLKRPEYLDAAPMGHSLGRRLQQFYEAGHGLPRELQDESFSLQEYVQNLLQRLRDCAPAAAARAEGVAAALAPFWEALPGLPLGFCHGDCHPLNVLWREQEAVALIDWEFCGQKPRLYDLANCLGCVGVERPSALRGEFALALLQALRPSLAGRSDAQWLPELLLALRFAWLSEWFRNQDQEMAGLELDYMELLLQNLDRLRQLWAPALAA